MSELVRRELVGSSKESQKLFQSLERHTRPVQASIDETARRLATLFQEKRILPKRASAARLHVALAVSAKADALVTTSPELKQAEHRFHQATVEAGYSPVSFRHPNDIVPQRRLYVEAISNPLSRSSWITFAFDLLSFLASRTSSFGRVVHWMIVGMVYLAFALAVVGAITVLRWLLA